MERSFRRLSLQEQRRFEDESTVNLYTLNVQVEQHNESQLRRLATPVAKIEAHEQPPSAKECDSNLAGGLEHEIYLSKDARIMLRRNLWTEKGLVNGALGFVREIIYEPECNPSNSKPVVILAQFDKYTGPTINGLVPIAPVTNNFKYKGQSMSRKQFPIQLAYSMSVHKSQGLTLDKALVDIGNEFCLGISYVALSRTKTWQGLALKTEFDQPRLLGINRRTAFTERKTFYQSIADKIIPAIPDEIRLLL